MTDVDLVLPDDFLRVPDRINLCGHVVTRHVAEGRGNRPALHLGQRTVTFAELESLTNRFGNALLAAGVEKGDQFVVRAPNSIEYVTAVLAGMKIGAVPIPAHSLYRAYELGHILANSAARLVFTTDGLLPEFEEVLASAAAPVEIVLLEGEAPGRRTLTEFLAGVDDTPVLADTSADDPAYAIYTSGTTGKPKGVLHAHRIVRAAGDPVVHTYMRLTEHDRCLIPTELAFMMTLDFTVFFPLAVGAQGVLYRGRFDPELLLQTVQDQRVTLLTGVPTMFRMLLAVPDLESRFDLSAVRLGLCGGEPMTEATFDEVRRRFGFDILEMIGQTEAHVYAVNRPDRPVKVGSLGEPIPGREVAVLDEDGKETAAGEVGHLCLRSDDPALALRYDGAEEQWRSLHRDGWFYTGDLVSRDDDGYLWYVARADDVILTRAYRVSPGEVEGATMTHPAVLEVGAIGVPDDIIGQRVKVFVSLRPGYSPSDDLAAEIIETVRSRIATYKVPKDLEFVDALPKNANGKILRRVLRDWPVAGAGTGG
ncbi:MAG TPA: acyl-CoA synthetase [Acidimicrobiia bacterium]|nr:acyl-CoA synthetase [Acidimicrobiia bacterium]